MNTCPQLKADSDARKFAKRLYRRGFPDWQRAYRYAHHFAYEMIVRHEMQPHEILFREWYFGVVRSHFANEQFNLSDTPGFLFRANAYPCTPCT